MKVWCGPTLVAAGLMAAPPAVAQLDTKGGTYLCDRGVEVPVAYVNGAGDSVAVLHLEGRLITLPVGPSGSGARYAWPSDGSGYVWWTKGDTAMLLWHDGATSEEVTLYAACKLKE
jgi:membrane-bound inhibitor of C-type lysozyme